MTDTLDRSPADETPAQDDPAGAEQRRAFLRLAVAVAVAAFLTVSFGVTATVLVVIALLVMVMLHEAGHYLTAKWTGMKVTEFFVGFGPRLWSFRRGETEYGIKAIPAGGYCRIVGMNNLEEVDPADEARTYRQQVFWKRVLVASAGSLVHFGLALLILFSLNAFVGLPTGEPSLRIESISGLQITGADGLANAASPAQQAGLRPGDRIVAVDGQPVTEWRQVPAIVRGRPGVPVRFTFVRDGTRLTRTVVPVDLSKVHVAGLPDSQRPTQPTGFVGIGPGMITRTVGPVAAVGESATQFARGTKTVFQALGAIFSPSGVRNYGSILSGHRTTPDAEANRFLSPVGFVRVASQAADTGLANVLVLLFSINLFVGIFNLVPLLPFDGGHVVVAVYEKIRSLISGRRYFADAAKLLPLTYVVVMLLLLIAVTSLYADIRNPISNPFR